MNQPLERNAQPGARYEVESLESLLQKDLSAWIAAKEAIARAKAQAARP